MAKKAKTYLLSDKLDFGKYKGWILKDLIKHDLSYVQWCIKNNDYFDITSETQKYINQLIASTSGDYFIFITDKMKFLAYLDKYAEDVVLVENYQVQSTKNIQLKLEF